MPTKKIFISYAEANDKELAELLTFLHPLKREQKIEIWSEQALSGGDVEDAVIHQQLMEADIILLLVSSSFLAAEDI